MEKQEPWPPQTTILYLKLFRHHSPKKFSNFLLWYYYLPKIDTSKWVVGYISLYTGLFKMISKQWYLRTIFVISDMQSFSIFWGPSNLWSLGTFRSILVSSPLVRPKYFSCHHMGPKNFLNNTNTTKNHPNLSNTELPISTNWKPATLPSPNRKCSITDAKPNKKLHPYIPNIPIFGRFPPLFGLFQCLT